MTSRPFEVPEARRSLRWLERSAALRLLLPALAAGLAAALLASGLARVALESRLDAERAGRARVLARVLQHEVASGAEPAALERLVARLSEESDVRAIAVAHGEPPRILASSDPSRIGRPLDESARWSGRLSQALARGRILSEEQLWRDSILTTTLPGPGSPGVVLVELRDESLRSALAAATAQCAAGAALLVLLVTGTAALRLRARLLRPLEALAAGLDRRQGCGDRDARAPAGAGDQIGRLGAGIHWMLEAQAESATRSRVVERAAGIGILAVDESGRVLSFDTGAERIFRWPAFEAVGSSVVELLPSLGARDAGRALWQIAELAESPQGAGVRRVPGRRSDGSEIQLELAAATLLRGGRGRVIAAVRELADPQQARAQEIAGLHAAAEAACEAAAEALEELRKHGADADLGTLEPCVAALRSQLARVDRTS